MGKYIGTVIKKLKWDTDFFGVDSYKCQIANENDLKKLVRFYKHKAENCFITAINENNKNAVNVGITKYLGESLFLADINMCFVKTLHDSANSTVLHGIQCDIRNEYPYSSSIENIAGYFKYSRFFNDENLGSQRYDIYKNWVVNSFDQKNKYYVVVKKGQNEAGFILFSKDKDDSATIELIAVDALYRGQSIGTYLISCMEEYLFSHNIKRIYVGTQVSNLEAINFYFKNGYKVNSINSIYHIWKHIPRTKGDQ